MDRIPYQIISTGSIGNAVVLNNNILIDCGVPYKKIEPYVKDIRLVLLTHEHGDHFNTKTILKIHKERPTVRFGCGRWLLPKLIELGVSPLSIDIYDAGKSYGYKYFSITPFELVHNVRNMGYKIHLPEGKKVLYATDTGSMIGIEAKGYDLYFVEANYEDEEIKQRIAEKKKAGLYSYEEHAIHNHLSRARCDDWLYANMGNHSEYIYMHQHVSR